jgi:NADPH-dependent 2,4-dienoyl-CoA reductase/sulfur reductase-like enzyme
MNEARFVILGGGMVAGYAAKQMVGSGLKPKELAILSADTSIPYERPPLSKGFLAGRDNEESIYINPQDFYRQYGIEVKLESEVTKVDAKAKRLTLKSGGDFGFDKLIIATGARPRTLGIPGSQLSHVHYLRSMDDSKSMRKSAERVKRAVVIGGGFIGMEVAAVLSQKSIDVTMVLNDDRIWKRLFTPQMSDFFEEYYAAHGVSIIKSAKITELRGDGAVNGVLLGGGQSIACEMVVAGIGVVPVTEVLANSAIEVNDGVVVNEYLETSQPDIYAAGDAASYQDVVFGKRRRVEHWDNAVSQGQHCAKVVMGERSAFVHVPYFFSDVFDLSYEYWGDSSGADQVIHRGELASKSFSVWWLRQKRLVAAFTMNRPDEERELAPKWIESKQTLATAKLQDEARPISGALE